MIVEKIALKPSIYKIAVTGGAGAGKSTICDRLREWGLTVISADELSREVVSPGSPALKKITESFGRRILNDDGTLNRQLLRSLITTDYAAKKSLDHIMHPEIVRLMHAKMADAETTGEPVVVVEVPLLFELGLEKEFDLVVLAHLDHEVRMDRIMARDHVSRRDAEALLTIQMAEEKKMARSGCVIDNNGSIENLLQGVDRLYAKHIRGHLHKNGFEFA